jgi:hypothetical protein
MMHRRLKSIPKNGVNSHKNLENYEIMNETVDAATRSSIYQSINQNKNWTSVFSGIHSS